MTSVADTVRLVTVGGITVNDVTVSGVTVGGVNAVIGCPNRQRPTSNLNR